MKNIVYHGDCVKVMAEFPENSVDLVVTSPPYDSLRTYNESLDWNFGVFKGVADGLARVLKDGGVIVWIVNDAVINGSESGSSFKQALHFKDLGLNLHDTMIWSKPGFSGVGALKTRYAPVFEYMFVLSKGAPKTFNPIKDRPNKSAGRTVTGTIRTADGGTKPMSCIGTVIRPFGQRFNIWEMSPVLGKDRMGHPAPFPINLAKDHITSWSNPGDTVLDPFAGSGTTLLACKQLNRDYIGIEKNRFIRP